jgi:prepilin-type processing-associated H-X9-DG protein
MAHQSTEPRGLRHGRGQALHILFFDGHVQSRSHLKVSNGLSADELKRVSIEAVFAKIFDPAGLPADLYDGGSRFPPPIRYAAQPTPLWRPWKPYFE